MIGDATVVYYVIIWSLADDRLARWDLICGFSTNTKKSIFVEKR